MKIVKKINCLFIALLLVVLACSSTCFSSSITGGNELKKYIGGIIKTDNSYSNEKEMKADDPQYNFSLGKFYVTGYTNDTEEDGVPVFLKTIGDRITLKYNLLADLDDLKGDGIYSINEDKNGYDGYFQTEKTNLGRGALFIRHINYENEVGNVQTYVNFLEGKAKGADVEVQLLEEGDYEFSLDYEIKKNNSLLIVPLPASYTNYANCGYFKVRNGNCMVYPMDVKTKTELHDKSITPDGFYLDLAKSRYLDINIKRKILIEEDDDIVEDTRFNKPAKDGDQYTEEGIYIITVKNKYTGESEKKSICVGNNKILKANFTEGVTVKEYKEKMANSSKAPETNAAPVSIEGTNFMNGSISFYFTTLVVVGAILIIFIIFIFAKKKKEKKVVEKAEKENVPDPEEEEIKKKYEDGNTEDDVNKESDEDEKEAEDDGGNK